MKNWVVLPGCFSGFRKWFPKPFPRQHDRKQKWVRGPSRWVWQSRSRVFRGSTRGRKHITHIIGMMIGSVRRCLLQWFCWCWQWKPQWESKLPRWNRVDGSRRCKSINFFNRTWPGIVREYDLVMNNVRGGGIRASGRTAILFLQ